MCYKGFRVNIYRKGAGMRKILAISSFMVCLLVPILAFSMEVTVEITGPQELVSLKAGIEKSVTTRCIAKGIALEKFGRLTISISKLGDIISYDALLDTNPARAFHKDFKDMSMLSATIDDMIAAIFTETDKTQAAPIPPAKAAQGQESAPKIKLPFVATSITAIGDRIYVSDTKTVYELKGEKASPLWQAPGKNEILRIYPYGESIIVLAKIMNECRSFRIQGSETKERWNKAVVPLGTGLISTNITFDKAFGIPPYEWSQPSQVADSSPQIPKDLDIISALSTEMKSSNLGPAVISYNAKNTLTLTDGKSFIWTDDTSAGITPQYIEEGYSPHSSSQGEPPTRYYLKPRIIAFGSKIVSFRNGQGTSRMISGLNLFEYTQILFYTPSGGEFVKDELAVFPGSYCPDITIAQGKVAALIVKSKSTYVQFLGL